MGIQTPILFCVFNRPDLTRRVFKRIAQQRPRRLLLACDGPRANSETDGQRVAEVREIVAAVDWPCEVQTFFADENRGCRQQMAQAITWGFLQAERLIILEDDCLPDPSFFGYCEALLDRYADDPRVMMISGDNFQPEQDSANEQNSESYYFSAYSHIWGWASWRRAWQHYDLQMSDWPSRRPQPGTENDYELFEPFCTNDQEAAYWREIFEQQHAGQIDTWDYSWAYTCWAENGLTILPSTNLVSNIGFGSDATHTMDPESALAQKPTRDIGLLVHPKNVQRNLAADEHTWQTIFRPAAEAIAAAKKQAEGFKDKRSERKGLRRWLSSRFTGRESGRKKVA